VHRARNADALPAGQLHLVDDRVYGNDDAVQRAHRERVLDSRVHLEHGDVHRKHHIVRRASRSEQLHDARVQLVDHRDDVQREPHAVHELQHAGDLLDAARVLLAVDVVDVHWERFAVQRASDADSVPHAARLQLELGAHGASRAA
jgi:hypothetical protein